MPPVSVPTDTDLELSRGEKAERQLTQRNRGHNGRCLRGPRTGYLFGGSGSTLIAAARLGRKAVLVEKDPGYADVIRQRWERFQAKVASHG